MGGGIRTFPPCIVQDILYNGRLAPVDLASLEASSYMFRAASRIKPYRFQSMTHTHPSPVREFPARPRSELRILARCEGNWKLVLHFLESLLQSSQRSGAGNTLPTASYTIGAWGGRSVRMRIRSEGLHLETRLLSRVRPLLREFRYP